MGYVQLCLLGSFIIAHSSELINSSNPPTNKVEKLKLPLPSQPPEVCAIALSVSHSTDIASALFDYDAQAEGDLSFKAGDQIVILDTSDPNGWVRLTLWLGLWLWL